MHRIHHEARNHRDKRRDLSGARSGGAAAELFRRHVIRRAAEGRLPAVMEELRLDGPE
jgi:hypothetical protein